MSSPSVCLLRDDRLGKELVTVNFPPRMRVGVTSDTTPSTASAATRLYQAASSRHVL